MGLLEYKNTPVSYIAGGSAIPDRYATATLGQFKYLFIPGHISQRNAHIGSLGDVCVHVNHSFILGDGVLELK